jgi:hypothetical protein
MIPTQFIEGNIVHEAAVISPVEEVQPEPLTEIPIKLPNSVRDP